MTAEKRGDDAAPGWDELPILDGEPGRAENLPLFEQEESDPDHLRGGRARRPRGAARRGDSAGVLARLEPAEPEWVQTALGATPAPHEIEARSHDGGTGEPVATGGELHETAPDPTMTTSHRPPLVERLLAGLADLVVHLAVLAGGLVAESLLGLQPEPRQWPGFVVFLVCFSFLYTTVPLAFWGQTPGMAWRGLRARDRGDRPLAFGQTALRWLGSLATAGLLGLPALLALGGRSLADRVSRSDTVVAAR